MTILELTLQTDNLKETENFYRTILDLKLIEETHNSITFAVGTSKLIYEKTNKPSRPKYHFAFNIPSNKIDEALKWLSPKIGLLKTMDNGYIINFKNWKAKAIYFYDSNQNILEFISREGLDNISQKEFTTDSIININEVGIVADEPLKLANKLIAQCNINYFSKGPKREDFVTIGEEDGLLVISNSDKKWFPSNDKAEKHKVKTKLACNQEILNLEFN